MALLGVVNVNLSIVFILWNTCFQSCDRKMSESWIQKWENERLKYERLGLPLSKLKDRIIRHKCSIVLGRDFGENIESYLERRGLMKYKNWVPSWW